MSRFNRFETMTPLTPYDIIYHHYEKGSALADTLIRHSELVRDKALALVENIPHLQPDATFVAEAALLHDIGIYQTDTPVIGCHGAHPYIQHGIIGRRIVERHGLSDHALVCERHVGTGITLAEIEARQLPLPKRDMLPTTIEEIIICYADKFFSKTNGVGEHSLDSVVAGLKRYGQDQADRFIQWHKLLTG